MKEVFRLRLASGREVEATANHPFLTYDGWRPLGELAARDAGRGTPARPGPAARARAGPSEVVLLAHLLGDGSFVARQPIRYASIDEANLARGRPRPRAHFGITAVRDDYPAARCTTLRLPAPYRLTHGGATRSPRGSTSWACSALRSHEKFVPERGLRPAEEADRAVPAPPVGDRRFGHGATATGGRAGLLRLDQPALVDGVAACCCGSASAAGSRR